MVDIDPNTVIIVFIALITVVGGAIAYIVKLSMRVNQLEKDLKNHPLLKAFEDIEHENLVTLLGNIISNSGVERN
ncbi:MAG: hypothetical protein NPMRTH1_50017 [Nitrosopumilales archaeon]|nr:MAG: hypothetical protein NPMRTH1_50017 [Nitrosopumilales archaeon]